MHKKTSVWEVCYIVLNCYETIAPKTHTSHLGRNTRLDGVYYLITTLAALYLGKEFLSVSVFSYIHFKNLIKLGILL
jgi:hypothetical protein